MISLGECPFLVKYLIIEIEGQAYAWVDIAFEFFAGYLVEGRVKVEVSTSKICLEGSTEHCSR